VRVDVGRHGQGLQIGRRQLVGERIGAYRLIKRGATARNIGGGTPWRQDLRSVGEAMSLAKVTGSL
jgi:hypothetical protein